MLTGGKQITSSEALSNTTAQTEAVGSYAVTTDGRGFRYTLVGGVTLAPGKLNIAPAVVTNHTDQTGVANAVGVTAVSLTLGATAATADQYRDGYLNVSVAPGPGIMYKISGHPAVGSAGTGTFNLYPDNPLTVAMTSSSKFSLVANPWANTIVGTTSSAARAVGVGLVSLVNATFGWLQTHGDASVLINGTPAKGSAVCLGATTGGSADIVSSTFMQIGQMLEAGVSTEFCPVKLTID